MLSQLLPLTGHEAVNIAQGKVLHHFGTFDARQHRLDRPIWVSDEYEAALGYRGFGVEAPYYTRLTTRRDFEILDLNGISLFEIWKKLGGGSHAEWNRLLGEYLSRQNVCGIVYAGREIFLPSPLREIDSAISRSSKSL
ncbi:hypothetical protein VCM43_29685 [Rhizobium sp. MJ21]|nr:hypothetical protein [Rhizobium sp. MJ21]